MKPFIYKKPADIQKAITAKKIKGSHFIAGGTNQVDLMKRGVSNPDFLVDVNSFLLKTITNNGEGVMIGAGVKNSDLANDKFIKENYPLLSKAILAGASPQIRNMASTGGNLLQRTRCPYFYDLTSPCNKRNAGSGCSAINGYNKIAAIFGTNESCIAVHPSDMCIALVALDATVHYTDGAQTKVIPFAYFHRLPGSTPQLDNNLPANAIITSISIPKNNFNKNCHYLKVRDRDSYAFALVSVAAALEIDGNTIRDARLAAGGVSHKPWRLKDVETFLKGKPANADTFEQAAALAVRGARTFEENAYKVPMLKAAVQTALQQSTKA